MERLRKSKTLCSGAPGWRSLLSVRIQPGHDLAVREFEPRVRLWADGSEPGACFRFCVSLSLCPSPVHALSLSVPKINKNVENKLKKKKKKTCSNETTPLIQFFQTCVCCIIAYSLCKFFFSSSCSEFMMSHLDLLFYSAVSNKGLIHARYMSRAMKQQYGLC